MKKISIFKANLIYLILYGSFFISGMFISNFNNYVNILFPQIFIVTIPAIILPCLFKGENRYKDFIRLNRVSLKTALLSFVIVALAYPLMALTNSIFSMILPSLPKEISTSATVGELNVVFSVFFLVLIPGIAEEMLFRGFFLKSFEEKKPIFSIVLVAFLFALYHISPFNFVTPFLLGIITGYMVYVTSSILPAIIGHVTNNFIALIITHVLPKAVGDNVVKEPTLVSTLSIIFFFLFIIMLLMFSISAFVKENKKNNILNNDKSKSALEFEETTYEEILAKNKQKKKDKISYWFVVIPGLHFFCLSAYLMWMLFRLR